MLPGSETKMLLISSVLSCCIFCRLSQNIGKHFEPLLRDLLNPMLFKDMLAPFEMCTSGHENSKKNSVNPDL